MKSKIAEAVGLRYAPVAVLTADSKPENALQFKKGKWGCVMFMFANAARGNPPPLTAKLTAAGEAAWGWGLEIPTCTFRVESIASPISFLPETSGGRRESRWARRWKAPRERNLRRIFFMAKVM